jgi:hypothetical protein
VQDRLDTWLAKTETVTNFRLTSKVKTSNKLEAEPPHQRTKHQHTQSHMHDSGTCLPLALRVCERSAGQSREATRLDLLTPSLTCSNSQTAKPTRWQLPSNLNQRPPHPSSRRRPRPPRPPLRARSLRREQKLKWWRPRVSSIRRGSRSSSQSECRQPNPLKVGPGFEFKLALMRSHPFLAV